MAPDVPEVYRMNLPPQKRRSSRVSVERFSGLVKNFKDYGRRLIYDPIFFGKASFVAIAIEAIVSVIIVQKVNYTEIDWHAYMQQVEGFVKNSSLDYTQLNGDTGPLVYPAGHLYVYTILYYLTDRGANVRRAQYIFIALYILLISVALRIYSKTRLVPPYCLIFLCFTAYRIHSICLLRLFNDPIAIILLYISILFIMDRRWTMASVLFSLALSIKMNILLFAPGFVVLMVADFGYLRAIVNITIGGIIQILLSAPFLYYNAYGYVTRAFNFGRIFEYKWTVNWRFLSEEFFVDRRFHGALLFIHLTVLFLFACTTWFRRQGGLRSALFTYRRFFDLDNREVLFVLFTSNFIGIAFSRSLHYQFYIWYFHSLPFLLWSIDSWPEILKITILLLIELSWNTYPSTNWSSASLHICHLVILLSLWCKGWRTSIIKKIS